MGSCPQLIALDCSRYKCWEKHVRDALRAGLIVFVFDGLDELCGHRNAVLSAEDVVDELANLAQGSNARILVSTRTAYWDAEIENQGQMY